MKSLLQAFLWTCTAVLLGLISILTMSALQGHFNKDTVTKIVALLNGIDIQGERLRQAVEQGRLVSSSSQDIAPPVAQNTDALNTLQTDLRSASLDRYKKELDERAARLQDASDRHKQLVTAFNEAAEKTRKEVQNASLSEVSELLSALEPVVAKDQIVAMLQKGEKDDVLTIIKILDADKLKKILAEFADIADQENITEILDEIRARGRLPATETASP